MKQSKKRSIQTFLTSYFVLFSFLMVSLMTVIMCRMQYRAAKAETIQTLRQTALSVADSTGQHLNQMNQVSLNAISSRELKDSFSDYFTQEHTAYERNQQRLKLANAMTTAKGFDFSIRQLNLFTLTGEGFGVGEQNEDLTEKLQDLSWHTEAEKSHGLPVVSVSGENVCLSRMFFNNINVPLGYAEVRKNFDTVFSLAEDPGISYPVSIHIYDKNGSLLYPVDEGTDSYFSYYEEAGEEPLLRTSGSGEKEIICFARSEKLDLTVAVSAERGVYLRQIYSFLFRILPVFLVVFILLIFLSVLISRRISSPIRQIYHFLADENKDRFSLLEMEETRIREIDKLQHSINDYIQSIHNSTDTLMILKEQEVQAQMLALQSQMNPHFLYNSLSAISEMAEEGLTEPVTEMCSMITDIMRYISSSREQRSTLQEELEICDMYLECLKLRFQEHLTWNISVSDDLLDIMIPKLCIQLLVENAVKSITTISPPWHVDITCEAREENWYVTVSDNGPGFDPEVERRLRSQMDQILQDGILPSLQIQGMGILNIFIRLYLLDGIPFIFDMGNKSEGGAFVMIGGRLKEDHEEGGDR